MLLRIVKPFLESQISLLLIKNILCIFDLDQFSQIIFGQAVRVNSTTLIDVMDGRIIIMTGDQSC
jgi:hypothetical protein